MEKWNLIVDVARCENCHNCTLSVKDEYVDNRFPGYAAPQPRHGHAWINIERRVRGEGAMVDAAYLPTMCNHCDDAPCIAAGGGCVAKRPDGIVLIDPDRAKGRRDLVDACPYGAIWWNEEEQLPQAWFFDAHLLDQGWTEPRCSHACPTGAMEALKISDAAMAGIAQERGLDVLKPELGTRPRVWYANLDRFTTAFLGGELVRSAQDRLECAPNVTVRLSKDGQPVATATSDAFGNFKFDGLPRNSGSYRIEAGNAAIDVEIGDSRYVEAIRID